MRGGACGASTRTRSRRACRICGRGASSETPHTEKGATGDPHPPTKGCPMKRMLVAGIHRRPRPARRTRRRPGRARRRRLLRRDPQGHQQGRSLGPRQCRPAGEVRRRSGEERCRHRPLRRLFGVLEKPNWQGGSTGASATQVGAAPRPLDPGDRHAPTSRRTTRRRSLPAVPRVRTPRITTRATGSTSGAPRGRGRHARRHEAEQGAQRRTTSDHQAERQGGRDDLPPVGGVGHLDRLDDVLVEGVRRGDELAHPLVGREEHAVARGVLDHHVGERAPGRVVPAADDDPHPAGAAHAGDAAGEALADPTGPHSCTRLAGSMPSAARPRATPSGPRRSGSG